MKKLAARFGVFRVVAVCIMAFGIILFLLTPLLLWLFDFDSDIFGVLIFLVGLVMFLVRLIVQAFRGKKQTRK